MLPFRLNMEVKINVVEPTATNSILGRKHGSITELGGKTKAEN